MTSTITITTGDNHGCFCRGWNPICDSGNPCLVGKEKACPVGGGGDDDDDVEVGAEDDDDLVDDDGKQGC